ncbi:MAG: hypothetical protein ACR2NG_09740 [Acidimicrobiia bacterium]
MSADGVWRIEELASGGWESVGTVFLENGRYLRGGVDAYTVGRYELDGDAITITATSTRLGGVRTVYGKDSGEIEITLYGELKGDEIIARATDGTHSAQYRYSRLGDMP